MYRPGGLRSGQAADQNALFDVRREKDWRGRLCRWNWLQSLIKRQVRNALSVVFAQSALHEMLKQSGR